MTIKFDEVDNQLAKYDIDRATALKVDKFDGYLTKIAPAFEAEMGVKLDADFMRRALTLVYAQVNDELYSALIAQEAFPVDTSGGTGLRTIEQYRRSGNGEMALVGSKSNDYPVVNHALEVDNIPVANYGNSFEYSFIELERAQRSGTPLNNYLAMYARRAAEERIDSVILSDGDPQNSGIKGVFGLDGVTTIAKADINGNWVDPTTLAPIASDLQMSQDLSQLMRVSMNTSDGQYMGDRIIMLPMIYKGLVETTFRTNTDSTVADLWRAKGIRILYSSKLNSVTSAALGLTNAQVALCYTYNQLLHRIIMPRPYQLRSPVEDNIKTKVVGVMDFSGIYSAYPADIVVADMSA